MNCRLPEQTDRSLSVMPSTFLLSTEAMAAPVTVLGESELRLNSLATI